MAERRPVRKIGTIVGQLMTRRGYARAFADQDLQIAVREAIGPEAAAAVRIGNLRAGVLQLYAADSVTMQELNFQKRGLLKRIQSQLPNAKITDLRFRIQAQ